jgi:hypothetical protein
MDCKGNGNAARASAYIHDCTAFSKCAVSENAECQIDQCLGFGARDKDARVNAKVETEELDATCEMRKGFPASTACKEGSITRGLFTVYPAFRVRVEVGTSAFQNVREEDFCLKLRSTGDRLQYVRTERQAPGYRGLVQARFRSCRRPDLCGH